MRLYLGITLFLGLLLWSAFGHRANPVTTVCVSNESGQPMIYVEVEDESGNPLMRTDLNGCFRLQASDEQIEVQLKYPGYEEMQLSLTSGEKLNVIMNAIKVWGNVYVGPGSTISLTESRGDFLIKGTVKDEGDEPLIGASILIKNTAMGTVTDIDGTFNLKAPSECVDLMVSYTGFESLEAEGVCADKPKIFILTEGVALEEVVVTGLGIRREKRALGYSSYSIDGVAASPPPPPPPPPASMATEMTKRADAPDVVYDPISYAAEDDAPYPTEPGIVAKGGDLPGAGQLTAGEVNDFSKWDMWTDINQEDLGMYRTSWQQYADHRYTLQLTNKDGMAVNNAAVELVDGQGNVLWKARTDAQGRAELWAHYFEDVKLAANGLTIKGTAEGKRFELPNAKSFKEGINFHSLRVPCREEVVIDMAFVVDATGSMGDEIRYLQAELLDVIERVQKALPMADLQTGSVFYRDEGEEYLTKTQPLTRNPAAAVSFLQEQYAQGGGDYPEAVEAALEAALDSLQWRDNATTRLLFLVLDAPPHSAAENIKRLQVAVTKAASRGIQIVPVSCSGVDKSTEYLLRSMALATNGTYTFITDHSGIGNAHIEPSTDTYEVEHLNDVLARLTISMSELANCDKPIAITEPDPLPDAAERNWDYYPNPSSGPLTIRFAEASGMFFLADTQGKLLQRFAATDGLKLDLGRYPAGTYWLRHEAEDGKITQGQVLLIRR